MSENQTTVSFRTSSGSAKTGTNMNKIPQKASSSTIRVGVWDLQSHEFTELAPPDDTESLFNLVPGSESVIGTDGRKPVPKKQIMPGGKYRAIVKLFLRFAGQPEGSSWAMATGWLIEKDLLVTAGHCAWDWSHDYGRLTHVKAYIGYSGKESIKDTNQVQLRMGIQAASTESWLTKGASNSRGDVSFIRLNKPFSGVDPIKYLPTPWSGSNVRLGVVGYPGDMMKTSTKEKGALMYEMFAPTTYTLDTTKDKMLQYTIDTFGGNSGSPVFRGSDMASIGVHVLGGNPNSASVISGKYGNSFEALKIALQRTSAPGKRGLKVTGNGYRWVTVSRSDLSGKPSIPRIPIDTTKKLSVTPKETTESTFESSDPSQQDSYKKLSGPTSQSAQSDELAQALKKATDVTVEPLGAFAAYALHVAGMRSRQFRSELEQEQSSGDDVEVDVDEAADEAENGREDEVGDETASKTGDEALDEYESTDETLGDDELGENEADVNEAADAAYEGVAERAMLTEAAFLTFVQLGPRRCKKLGYLKSVRVYVEKYGRTCGRAGVVVLPGTLAPALRATVLKIKQETGPIDHEANVEPANPSVSVDDVSAAGFGPRLDANKEAIIQELTRSIESSGSEAIDSEICDIFSKGLRIPGPIIAHVAETDLGDLVQRAEAMQPESNLEAAMEDQNSNEYLYDAMAQRALIGEAMLEAIMNTPMELQREEGIFGSISSFFKKDGKAMNFLGKVAGGIKNVAPFVGVGMAAYTISKDIYNMAKKKKKELVENNDPDAENIEDSPSTGEDDWSEFFDGKTE